MIPRIRCYRFAGILCVFFGNIRVFFDYPLNTLSNSFNP